MCLLEQCDGLEVCRANVVQSSLGEPCPVLGSYLSVQHHCEDGQSAPIGLPPTLRINNNVPFNYSLIDRDWLRGNYLVNVVCYFNATFST